ncbi:MAG TPA: hypothetical protein VEN81_00815 [Planctomycetota bacterium]|jgi:hypothetical protein|nr:hypothetical protein [Planctomycetota bacterium]
MGLGICIVGVSILLGISLNSEKVYALYLPPGAVLFFAGQWMTRRKG